MTNEAIEKLPQPVREHLELYNGVISTRKDLQKEFKHRLQGYLNALKDAGIITEAEKRVLYIRYVTIWRAEE